jgi:hypothetical protein
MIMMVGDDDDALALPTFHFVEFVEAQQTKSSFFAVEHSLLAGL